MNLLIKGIFFIVKGTIQNQQNKEKKGKKWEDNSLVKSQALSQSTRFYLLPRPDIWTVQMDPNHYHVITSNAHDCGPLCACRPYFFLHSHLHPIRELRALLHTEGKTCSCLLSISKPQVCFLSAVCHFVSITNLM